MRKLPDPGIGDAGIDSDIDVPACVEALLAATMALMTGHAQACCEDHRSLIAEKAAVNLQALSRHPLMSPAFQAVAWSLHMQWVQRIRPEPQRQAPASRPVADSPSPSSFNHSRALWHTTPEVIQ